ncbi:Ger(x)C family spore germination C-terminal domain-containing protein [Clostridium sardiniense]|uniref:Ger(x)C family spore germination C-terminal domain-containing protein n=1 Tax=Clostridium sardiniense TaxID=29369 RepID=UPI00195CEAB2|nr:Ger(x)C family spore germination C-terminal domain-containing protein [Clostridium sardiniense]MBM7833716.1 Ger(x)C family germination protein [Clostridium sardiniense]
MEEEKEKVVLLKTIKRYSFLILLILFLIIISTLYKNKQFAQIEDIDFVAGVGYDINTDMDKKIYSIPVLVYDYSKSGSAEGNLLEAKGVTPVESRVNRQLHSGKKFSLGTEKAYIFSKKVSLDGLEVPLDGLMKNNQVSNSALIITTSNDPKDVLSLKIPGYPTAPDYIAGLVKSLEAYSYFSTKHSLFTAYIDNSTEGCKFIAPNMDIINDKLSFTSMSVFNKGRLVASIPVTLMKYVNTLRNDKGSGIATFSLDDNNFITFNLVFKRKVDCTKNKDGIFNFDITIDVNGTVANNNTSIKSTSSPSEKKQLEKRLSDYMKSNLTDFIDIMKSEYKMDLLNLGHIAAAKYGRHKITNWDEEILKSSININVNFKINRFGLGKISFN